MISPKEQRRSRRIRHELVVELHEKGGARRLHAIDVARHGLFLATDNPPRERHLVQLTVHLPRGPIRAAGSVTRTLRGNADHEDGVGIQFFALSDEAKERWDEFIFELQRATPARGTPKYQPPADNPSRRETSTGATFLVKLKTPERLKEFAHTHLAAGGTVLFTPVLKGPGEFVTLIVVHPKSDEEFRLPGVIHKAHSDRPKRLEIHFHGITPALLNSFAAFVETGFPPTVQLSQPLSLPSKQPEASPVPDLDLDVDVFDEDTLDTDDRIWRPPDVMATSPSTESAPVLEPMSPTRPTAPGIDPGFRPATYLLRCDACSAEPYAVDIGPCRGVLGLVADHSAFVSSKTGRVVTVPRLAAVDERQTRVKSYLENNGRLDASIDIMTLLGAVALVEPPKDGDGSLKATRAVERLEHAARRLVASDKPAKTRVSCAVCRDGHLTVERVDL